VAPSRYHHHLYSDSPRVYHRPNPRTCLHFEVTVLHGGHGRYERDLPLPLKGGVGFPRHFSAMVGMVSPASSFMDDNLAGKAGDGAGLLQAC
jgi:hypothetical protein